MLKLTVLVSCVIFLSGDRSAAKPTYPHLHDDDCLYKDNLPFSESYPSKSIPHNHHAFSAESQEHLPDSSRWPFHHNEQYHKNHGFHHDYHNIHDGFPYDSDEGSDEDMKKSFPSFKHFHNYHSDDRKPFPTFKTHIFDFEDNGQIGKKPFPTFDPFDKPQKPKFEITTTTTSSTFKPLTKTEKNDGSNFPENNQRPSTSELNPKVNNQGFGNNNNGRTDNNNDNQGFTVKPTSDSSQESSDSSTFTTNKPESPTRKTVDLIPVTENVDDIINKIFTPRPRTGSSRFPTIDVRSKNNNEKNIKLI